MAVIPSVSDPRLNTVECVIPGHGKAPQFSGVKQLLHGVCWSLLVISLAISALSSQLITVKLRSWDGEDDYRSKTAATMFLSLLLFLGGLAYNLYICISATKVGNKQEISYVWVFFGSILFVLFRRLFWCMFVYEWKCFSERNLTGGHGEMTTKNLFFWRCTLSSSIHCISSSAVDFAGYDNRTILGFYCFSGCYCSLCRAFLLTFGAASCFSRKFSFL